jgi:hypothetical protein
MPDISSIMQNTMGSMFTLITLALGAVSVVLIVFGFAATRTPGKSKDWPTVTGQVLASTITYRSGSRGSRSPYPFVMYTYQVAGQQYQSQRIYFGSEVGGSAMTGVIKKYPIGAQIPVYYNPQNPADAVLEHSSPASKVLIWIGLILIAVAAATYFMPKFFGF